MTLEGTNNAKPSELSYASLAQENDRLRKGWEAAEVKNRELEETIARCVARGINLRDALRYYDDRGGPARAALARDEGQDEL